MENMQQENALRRLLRQTFRMWPLSYVAVLVERLSGALLQAFPDSLEHGVRSPKSPGTERRLCHVRKRLSNVERLLSRLLPSWILEPLLGIPSPSSFGNPSSSDEIKASPVKLFGKGSKRKQEAVLEEEEEEEEDEDEEYDEDKDIETDEFEMEDMPGSEEELMETLGCSVETVLQKIESVMADEDEQEKEECRKEECAVKAHVEQTDAAEKELSEKVKILEIEEERSTSERQSQRDDGDKEEYDYHAIEEVEEEEDEARELHTEEKADDQFKAACLSSDLLPEEDSVEDLTYESPQLESSNGETETSPEGAEEESQMTKGADEGIMSQPERAEKEFDENVEEPSTNDGQSRSDESKEEDQDMEEENGELDAEEKAYEQFKAACLSSDLPEEDSVEDLTYETESSDEVGEEESPESAVEDSKMTGGDEGSQPERAEKEFDENVEEPSTSDGQSRSDESQEEDQDMEEENGELDAEEKAYEQFKASCLSSDFLPEEDSVEDLTYEMESSVGEESPDRAVEDSKMTGGDEFASSESQKQEYEENVVCPVEHAQLPLRVGPIALSGSAMTEKRAVDSSTEGKDGVADSGVKPGISNGHGSDSQTAVMEENLTEEGMYCFDGKKSAGGEENPAFNDV